MKIYSPEGTQYGWKANQNNEREVWLEPVYISCKAAIRKYHIGTKGYQQN